MALLFCFAAIWLIRRAGIALKTRMKFDNAWGKSWLFFENELPGSARQRCNALCCGQGELSVCATR